MGELTLILQAPGPDPHTPAADVCATWTAAAAAILTSWPELLADGHGRDGVAPGTVIAA